jgi:hypothetical protein
MKRRPADKVSDLPSYDHYNRNRAEIVTKTAFSPSMANTVIKVIWTKNIMYAPVLQLRLIEINSASLLTAHGNSCH